MGLGMGVRLQKIPNLFSCLAQPAIKRSLLFLRQRTWKNKNAFVIFPSPLSREIEKNACHRRSSVARNRGYT